jgi:hypothetical protein
VWEEKYGENAEEYSDGTFDEEDERPSFIVLGVDFGKTCSKKSTKCTRPIKVSSALQTLYILLFRCTYNGAAQ